MLEQSLVSVYLKLASPGDSPGGARTRPSTAGTRLLGGGGEGRAPGSLRKAPHLGRGRCEGGARGEGEALRQNGTQGVGQEGSEQSGGLGKS